MSNGGNLGDPSARLSASVGISAATIQDASGTSVNSLCSRVQAAKEAATSILQDPLNWPQNSTIAVQELLETISNAPNLQRTPLSVGPMPNRLWDSLESFTMVMEDVYRRLDKIYKKYGTKREISDKVRHPFASLSKDGCSTALRGCRNDVENAMAFLRNHLERSNAAQPVSQEQVSPHPVTPHSEQNSPASGIQGPPISQVASTHPNIASAPQIDISNLPLAADTGKTQFQSSTALSPPDRTLGRRRERLDGARTTFETIEAVSGTIPVVGSFVGAGAKVGLAVVKMIQTMDSNTETGKDLEGRTTRLSDLLGRFKKPSVEHQREEFLENITELQSELQAVKKGIEDLNKQGTLRNLLSSSGRAEELKGHQDAIHVALEELQLLVSLNTTNLLNELYDTEKRKEQRRLLDRLGDASYGARGNTIEQVICLPGTRVEVLEHIDDWIRDTSPSERVLWIRGMAGRGKSTLASTVAYNWRYRAAFAIFHFRRGQNGSDRRLVCSLARQLGSSVLPEVKEAVLQSIRENEDVGQERLQEQFKVLFVASAERLRDSTPPILIIVDALDECEDIRFAVDFVNLLHQHASTLPTNFKFLLTTRPETPLLRALEPRQWRTEDLDIIVTIDNDITELVQRRFSEMRENHGLADDWPPQAAMQSLVRMSQGLFQWTQTALEYISEGSPEVRLEELLESPSLFDGLDNLYTQILSKAYEKAKKRPNKAELLLYLLGTLTAAAYPLSLDVFTYLSAEQPMFCNKGQQQILQLLRLEILSDLRSLVYIPDSSNQPMRLVHTSVRDLLVNRQRCGGKPYFIDLDQNHRDLTVQCVALMLQDLRKNMCKLSDLSKANAEVRDLVEREVPIGLAYCCRSWSTHLTAGNWLTEKVEPSFKAVLSDLKSFSETKLLCWLEVMSLLGATIDAMSMAKHVHAWIQGIVNVTSDPELTAIWNDAHRFIGSFFEPVSFGALHIYASALPFCPTNTKIWEYYSSQALNRILHGPQDLVWPPNLWARWVGVGVQVVIFLRDGKVLASGCSDCTIRLWDCETGTQLGEPLIGHKGRVQTLALSPDGKTLASGSHHLCLWDAESGDLLCQPLEEHTTEIKSLTFSPDGKTLISASHILELRFWDRETGISLGPRVAFNIPSPILGAVSVDAKFFASTTGVANRDIQLFDVRTGTQLGEPLTGHNDSVTRLAFSPCGKILASGSHHGTIGLWDPRTGAPIHFPLRGHSKRISSLAFSPDGDILASGLSGGKIQLWDVRTGSQCGEYQTHNDLSVDSLAFSPNSKILASGSHDQTVQLWDVPGAPPGTDLPSHQPVNRRNLAVIFSPDGKILVCGRADNTIQLWDAKTGTSLNTLPASHSESIFCLAFSPDGKVLASGSADSTICLWDTTTWSLLGVPLTGHSSMVRDVAFSWDGKVLASGSYDETAQLWDVKSRTPLDAPRVCHDYPVTCLVFSPDGKFLVTGCQSGMVQLWDIETGAPIGSPQGHPDDIPISLEFLPEGEGEFIAKYDNNRVLLYSILQSQSSDPDAIIEYRAHGSFQAPFVSLCFGGPWVSFFSQRLFWVPAQYWARYISSISVCQGRLAFSSQNGELFILDVSQSLSL